MKKSIYFLFFVAVLSLFLNGCAFSTAPSVIPTVAKKNGSHSQPSWIDDPEKEANGKLTAVGCASKHINGEVAQRKLALQRAIDEIAMQKKTKVQMVHYATKSFSNSAKTSTTQSSSLHEVENIEVSTKVMEYYTKSDGDICVWVVEN